MGIYASEEWRDVKGWEDRYEVSSFGRVRSKSYLKQTRNMHGPMSFMTKSRFMKLSVNSDGYCTIDLCKNKTRHTSLVHRLVAEVFIENLLDLPVINHKDSVRTNNAVDNLEWSTQKYNVQHGYNTGSNSNAGEKHPRKILSDLIVRNMRSRFIAGESVAQIADDLGFRRDTTKSAITGKNWGHVV